MRVLLSSALMIMALASFGVTPSVSGIGFGVRVQPSGWQDLAAVMERQPSDPQNPLHVTLYLPAAWATEPDWASFDAAIHAVLAAHAELTVATELPSSLEDPFTFSYLSELSARAGSSSETLAFTLSFSGQPEELRTNPGKLAFLVKRLALALRGHSAAEVLLGDIAPPDIPVLESLLAKGLRAYVDGFCARAEGESGGPPIAVSNLLSQVSLGTALLLHLPRLQTPIVVQLAVVQAASHGFDLTDLEPHDISEIWPALLRLRNLLPPAMGIQTPAEITAIEGPSGPRQDIAAIGLLDPDRMVQGVLLVPSQPDSPPGLLSVRLPTTDITGPSVYPLPSGDRLPLVQSTDNAKQETLIKVPWDGRALLVLYERLKTGTVGAERLSVSARYRPPIEVVIARHQAVQETQDLNLKNYRADARVEYDFNLPGGAGDLPVSFLNTYFYEKGEPVRWLQNKLLIGGVVWKGRIPELPAIDPQRANTPPMALTLSMKYAYRDLGDEKVGERDCYRVGFEPLASSSGRLFPGQAWIDKQTYALVRMNVKQTNLEEPQVSNDETQTYAPFTGPDGRTYWLLDNVQGQQIFSIGPITLVANRTVTFSPPVINGSQFEDELAKAEAGDSPILQETDRGFRYFEKKDGGRTLRADQRRSWLLGQAGFYYDRSFGSPMPLVGINYFNYNWLGTRSQLVLFAAGALNSATLSKVNIFPNVDGNFQGTLLAMPYQDSVYPSGEEDRRQRLKMLQENVAGSLGWRFSAFSKLSLNASFVFDHFARASSTAPAFELPKDNLDSGLGLSYTVSWRGWSAVANYEEHLRSAWEDWGLPSSLKSAEGHRSYSLWGAFLGKTFSLPASQKIGASLAWMDGKDLDRFSRYQFSYLGRQSLAGFAGSGVRFDRGAIATLSYNFNLADVVRFDLRVNEARVQPIDGSDLTQRHTGLGLRASVGGPWQTYWTLDFGYALQSDIPPVTHQKTVALVIWKLF